MDPPKPTAPASSRFGQRLERRVLRYVQRHGLFSDGQQVLLAVSGGPDSTALLAILAHLSASGALGLGLTVAHFDHGLRRRSERQAERAAVSELATRLGLPLVVGEGDVRAHARRRRLSREEAARELRYRFLAEEAESLGIGTVATGHTADDQAETVLLHLIRGSGLAGLAGMRPGSSWPFGGHQGLLLARPLLDVIRQETERYCREEGLTPCLDVTNLLLEPLRNRVRHELIPLLRRYNPKIEAALLRLASAAAADAAYLEETAGGIWSALATREEGSVSLPRREVSTLSLALQRRLLQAAGRHLLGADRQIEAVHVQAMLETLAKRGGGRLSRPGGLSFLVDRESVRLSFCTGEAVEAKPILETPLNIPGRTVVGDWTVQAEVLPAGRAEVGGDPNQALLDAEAVGEALVVRSRRRGDRFRPLGLGGEKKLQDHLVDAKVPRHQRDAVPLVCAPWGIAWVVGHRIDERAKVREGTSRVLRLRFRQRLTDA
jgi:tRNA(Ile)-lysidine synthase